MYFYIVLFIDWIFVECRSFGIALWEVFTFGDIPYGGLSNENVLQRVVKDGTVRLSEPDLPVANVDRL